MCSFASRSAYRVGSAQGCEQSAAQQLCMFADSTCGPKWGCWACTLHPWEALTSSNRRPCRPAARWSVTSTMHSRNILAALAIAELQILGHVPPHLQLHALHTKVELSLRCRFVHVITTAVGLHTDTSRCISQLGRQGWQHLTQ